MSKAKAKARLNLKGFEDGFEEKSATDKFERIEGFAPAKGKAVTPTGKAKAVQP